MFHEHDKVNLTLFPPNLFFPRPLSRPRHPGKPSGRKPWSGSARLPLPHSSSSSRLHSPRRRCRIVPTTLLLSIATALLRALATSHRTVLGSAPPGWTQSRPSRPLSSSPCLVVTLSFLSTGTAGHSHAWVLTSASLLQLLVMQAKLPSLHGLPGLSRISLNWRSQSLLLQGRNHYTHLSNVSRPRLDLCHFSSLCTLAHSIFAAGYEPPPPSAWMCYRRFKTWAHTLSSGAAARRAGHCSFHRQRPA